MSTDSINVRMEQGLHWVVFHVLSSYQELRFFGFSGIPNYFMEYQILGFIASLAGWNFSF